MPQPSLPHHRLLAWHLAAELVRLVNDIRISDAEDRREARRAAKSCARNVAEGAGRTSRADKARVYAIARGECGECVASVELAGATSSPPPVPPPPQLCSHPASLLGEAAVSSPPQPGVRPTEMQMSAARFTARSLVHRRMRRARSRARAPAGALRRPQLRSAV